MARLLIIEGRDTARPLIETRFSSNGLSIESALTVQDGLGAHKRNPFDIVLWDTMSAPSECLNVTRATKKFLKSPVEARMIIISDVDEPDANEDGDLRRQWIRQPVDETELCAAVETALQIGAARHRPVLAGREIDIPIEFEGMLVNSLAMRSVIEQIIEAAAADIPILITGETGTGKDLVAAAIHKRSKRKSAPYLAVNMGAIASELIASELFGHEKGAYTGASEVRAGLFEQAQGGTIFLDEITTMNEKTQVSLLRVLETKTVRRVGGERDIKVDVRVIAASNENIEEAVKQGRFREDLYYRLDVFRIHLPALRERAGGVSLLTDHYISRFDEMYKKDIRVVSPTTYRLLRRYPWPGNVRELKNVIQRAVLMAKGAELTPDLLPARIRQVSESAVTEVEPQSPIRLGMSLADVEREFIKMTLSSVSGNKMKAASVLRISRRALYNKLKRFGVL